MNKKSHITILMFFWASLLCAQDILYKKDNTKIETKILEITPLEIKYKLFTYQDGPIITISKKDVALIIYQNGLHEVINTPSPIYTPYILETLEERAKKLQQADSLRIKKWETLTSTKNLISVNTLGFFNSELGLSYTREFPNAFIQLCVPVTIGYADPSFNDMSLNMNSYGTQMKLTKKVIETGISTRFNTSKKRAITHFIGTYFGIAQFNGIFKEYVFSPSSTNNYIDHAFVLNRYYVLLENGFLYRFHQHFNMSILLGAGMRFNDFIQNNPSRFNSSYSYYNNDFVIPFFPINTCKLALSVGYRF